MYIKTRTMQRVCSTAVSSEALTTHFPRMEQLKIHLAVLLLTISSAVHVVGYGSCRGHSLLQSGGLSCQEKQGILNSHNTIRQKVAQGLEPGQPSAARMLEMVWDEELARVAQRWADECVMGHDTYRDVSRFPVGQNVAATWTTRRSVSPDPDFHTQIQSWRSEVRSFSFYSSSSGVTGHYTQLVWGDTYLVGCGYSFYYDRNRGYTKLYVCNYGPGGNVVGQTPYQAGSPACSGVGVAPSRKFPGLCEVQGYSSLGSGCSYGYLSGYESYFQ